MTFHMYCHDSLLGKLKLSHVTPIGKHSTNLLLVLPHVPFLSSNLTLHCFIITKLNGACNGMLCSIVPLLVSLQCNDQYTPPLFSYF